MLTLTVDTTQSLKDFTDNNYAQASFYWSYLLKNKEIKVNGKKVGENVLLSVGDTVSYYLSQKQAEKPAFYIVYQDENILIIDKESGVNSEAVYAELRRIHGENCRFIHRLDRNTRGLMAFAFNEHAETSLLNAFKNRTVEKKYRALCFGRFSNSHAILKAYLKKNEERATVQIFDLPSKGAEEIITEYQVYSERDGMTEVEITLHTGKTHQIRAHLAHIGCPVVGDMKYGDTNQNKAKNLTRQCLIAKELTFYCKDMLSYLNGMKFVSRFDFEL
jgi:23S rRNA pseudouridine955/2504/2580 synthase